MARNGSGTMLPVTNSWNPQVNGVNATGPDFLQLYTDLLNALTQSISNDGQTPIAGNLNMNNQKLVGLAAGTSTGDSLRWQQLFDQGVETVVASAATTDIGIINSNFISITGTTGITSFGTNYRGPRFLRFAGVLPLTNSATLVLPGNADITTAAGDTALAYPIGDPATGWVIAAYRSFSSLLTPPVSKIFPITASVATNILTASILPCSFDIRSATLGSGTVNSRTIPATISLSIPATATLGTVSGVSTRLILLAIDNAGTIETAIINLPSTSFLDETGLISTTAISTGSNSANVVYSTIARSNVPYRVAGFIESTQATAGTWATAPSKIQGGGGEALVYLGISPSQNLAKGNIYGYSMSTAGASTTMTISSGQASDSTNSLYISLLSSISKTTGSWVVGNGNGGKLSAAAIAPNTTYHFFVIYRSDTAVTDVGFDISITPTLPTNYTHYRRIFSAITDGSSQWVKVIQTGDNFDLDVPVLNYANITSQGAAAVTRTASVPTGVIVEAKLTMVVGNSGSGDRMLVSSLAVADTAPAVGNSTLDASNFSNSAASGQVRVFTNTSAQYRTRLGIGNASVFQSATTVGWIDTRGRSA